jgi:hypothetical protein
MYIFTYSFSLAASDPLTSSALCFCCTQPRFDLSHVRRVREDMVYSVQLAGSAALRTLFNEATLPFLEHIARGAS